ncbi:TIGR03936 family radical SAM-associated protein [Thermoclostridium stercorarium]|uniref:TIGR03936 family radical SAM-associated protein n=1 Tax=Thermoclostridium stercorarium TaxID=1510 RepID=UPI0006D13327|nr:TIGR03936 family radical SAM-associated protein [Thermoclostridium stercorarium]
MKIRFRFDRGEELKYIGHLDVMRLFERAFKRAEIPVTHSQGFNPRPHIVFAQPMALGFQVKGNSPTLSLMKIMSRMILSKGLIPLCLRE